MENILYDKKVRRKRKSWFNFLSYYENEKISLKEKLYTYLYNFNRTGLSTKGEVMYFLNVRLADNKNYRLLESDFNIDYTEYLNNPQKI